PARSAETLAGRRKARAAGTAERGPAPDRSLPQRREQGVGVLAIRPPRRVAHGATAVARRRRAAPPAVAARSGALARRLRADRFAAPAGGRRARGSRSGAERRLRRRQAARRDGLPESREPR